MSQLNPPELVVHVVGPWQPASIKPTGEGQYLTVVRNYTTKNLTQHVLYFSVKDESDWWGMELMSGEILFWMSLPPLPVSPKGDRGEP